MSNKISETAFLVNYHRAKFEDISQDIYAKYWVTPEAISLSEKLSKEVYENDDMEICLRNRFFLENLRGFIKKNKDAVFVNLGAGFTSYPYLCDISESIEIDLPHIINFKKNKISSLTKEGKLPDKIVQYIGANLQNESDINKLKRKLRSIILGRKSFFLLEGITYYIAEKYLKIILQTINELQPVGSEIGVEYWSPELLKNNTFKKLTTYAEKHFNYKKEDFNLYDTAFFQKLKGYKLMELTTIARFEKYLGKECIMFDENKNLVTSMGILGKN